MENNENQHPRKKRFAAFRRGRFAYVWLVGLIVIALSLLTDPDSGYIQQLRWGAGTIATLIILSKGVLYATLVHYTRKGLIDYFRMEDAWNICKQNPMAAGMFTIAVSISTLAYSLAIYTSVSK